MNNQELIDGRWYWVRKKKGEWFPDFRDEKGSSGGWGDQNTWEDWNKEVVEWLIIEMPENRSE